MKNLLRYGIVVLAIIASTELLWADSYAHVIHDTIIKVDTQFIQIIDTAIVHDTCMVVLSSSVYPAEHSAWWDFLLPLLVSIIGAFGALLLTYTLLKPRFEIASVAARSLNNRVWFVVKNTSCFAKLYSIKAELYYVKENQEKQDLINEKIDLDGDDTISILHPEKSKKVHKKDTFYVFHTRYPFSIGNEEQVRLRVSATNTISNIFDAIECDFKKNNIRWGEYKGNVFISVDEVYEREELKKAEELEAINEKLYILFREFRDKYEFVENKNDWDESVGILQSLKTKESADNYWGLTVTNPTVTEMLHSVEILQNIYENSVVYSARKLDSINRHKEIIKRNLVQIAQYMAESIEPNRR